MFTILIVTILSNFILIRVDMHVDIRVFTIIFNISIISILYTYMSLALFSNITCVQNYYMSRVGTNRSSKHLVKFLTDFICVPIKT